MKQLVFKRKIRDIGGGSVGFSVPIVFMKADILKKEKVYKITIELIQ